MKIAVFGGSGATGRWVIEQALQADHEVSAMLRRPDALTISHPRLKTVVGSFAEPDVVRSVVRGADVVVSTLGANQKGPVTICADGARAILAAMKPESVKRLIALSAYGAGDSKTHSLSARLVRKIIASKMHDKDQMEALVQASGLDWTLLRPPALTNGPRTGTYRTGENLPLGFTSRISRADVADFIVREASASHFIRQAVMVSK